MDEHNWPRCVKSARQKRRLVKTDRDKQLIQLEKRRSELWQQRRLLPLVKLEQPYQRGWKRFFVLRDDVKRDPTAKFYEGLLTKINTVEYHHDKLFKRRKRRKGNYKYRVKEQLLRGFDQYSWDNNRTKLTEQEKARFTRLENYNIKTGRNEVTYVFAEPWRYLLKIAPNMVTHKKLLDPDLESERAWIENHIDKNGLSPRIDVLIYGGKYRYRDWYTEPAKYINKIKNVPRYSPKEAYLELET